MQNPFEDLMPKGQQSNTQGKNPFSDLMPSKATGSATVQQASQPSWYESGGYLDRLFPSHQSNLSDQSMRAQLDQRSPIPDIAKGISSEYQSAQGSEAKMKDRILRAQLNQRSPFMPGKSESSKYGDVTQNLTETVGNSLMDFAPWMMTGQGLTAGAIKAMGKFPATAEGLASFAKAHPKFASYLKQGSENIISSGGYAGANAEEGGRLSEAALGAGLGAGFALGGAGIDAALKYGAKKYAQNAIPKFTEKSTEEIRKLPAIEEQAAALEKKHTQMYGKNKENWTEAEKKAAELDEKVLRGTSGESGFDASPYNRYIEEHVNKVKEMEPAIRSPYMQSIDAAKLAAEQAPQSFKGAIAGSKNINESMSDLLKSQNSGLIPENMQTKQFLGGLKNNLRNETVDANAAKLGQETTKDFKQSWENANKSNQELQEFYKTPNKATGVLSSDKKIKEAFRASLPESQGGKGEALDQAIIGRYMPQLTDKGYQGTAGIRQLGKIIGSQKQAKEAAIAHLMQGQIVNGAKTVDVAARYGQMSVPLRKYLFGNREEGKFLDAINRTRKAFGREPEKTLTKANAAHSIAGYGVPTALGYFGSKAAGENEEDSIQHAVEALGLSKGLKAFGIASANVPRVNRAIAFGEKGSPRTTNIGRHLNTAYNLAIPRQEQ